MYNSLNAKYGRGTYWILAGDTNTLKLDPILTLNNKLKNVITRIYHNNPSQSNNLDNIITDLHMFYQEPDLLPPTDPDLEIGKPTDHLTIVLKPINVINNTSLRKIRTITGKANHRLWSQTVQCVGEKIKIRRIIRNHMSLTTRLTF